MDGDDQLTTFATWLRDLAAQAGYDPDTRGGIAALARAAGTDRGQTSRALRGEARPKVDYLRAYTQAFNRAGVNVTLREMLIRSGTLLEDDLPRPGETPPPPVSQLDLYRIAREQFGIPEDKLHLFVRSVESVANAFADEPKTTTISESPQTGGHLSAER
jgi:hypothetical protein